MPYVRRLQYEIRAEFRTASDERAGPGNEAKLSLVPRPHPASSREGKGCGVNPWASSDRKAVFISGSENKYSRFRRFAI